MVVHAKGAFELKSFDEKTYEEAEDGTKLTRAHLVQTMTGDLDGEATSDLLMFYRPDGTASIVGFQRFTGTIGERSGSFVQQSIGGFDGTQATATTSVVSGTGDLSELRGDGTSAAPHGSTGTYTLDYDLD